jgi:hypothetical protein
MAVKSFIVQALGSIDVTFLTYYQVVIDGNTTFSIMAFSTTTRNIERLFVTLNHNAECCILFIFILDVIILSVVRLNVIMLSAVLLNVIRLSVVVPSLMSLKWYGIHKCKILRFQCLYLIGKKESTLFSPKFSHLSVKKEGFLFKTLVH